VGDSGLRGRAGTPAGRAPAQTLAAARRRRDVALVLVRGGGGRAAARRHGPEGWEAEARERFLAGYTAEVDPAVLPAGASSIQNLLAIFELERAIYELRYELNQSARLGAIPVTCIHAAVGAAPA